ncbi:MAG: hypothetical protein M3016_01770, partial [Actinomycetota bacterium]|nr:hypothetical protein [Actinomycetota bacterium]
SGSTPTGSTPPGSRPSDTPTGSATVAASTSRQALTALQAGRTTEAAALADQALGVAPAGSRDWQDALLVLGLSQRQAGDPAAAQTLQQFLSAAPDHPAVAMVQRLLQSR